MGTDVKRFESLYDVVLTQRQAKDIVAEFKGGGLLFAGVAKRIFVQCLSDVTGHSVDVKGA